MSRYIARLIGWLEALHRAWYLDEYTRERRRIEEDARRFGGSVTWREP